MNALTSIPIKHFLEYWRNTLADEDLMGLSVKDSLVSVEEESFQIGRIGLEPLQILQKAWERQKKQEKHSNRDADQNRVKGTQETIPVVLFLKGFAKAHKHGQVAGKNYGGPYYALHIPARLDPSGAFSFSTEFSPWIGRQFLFPNENSDNEYPLIGSLEEFDTWLTKNPFDVENWNELTVWCDKLWQKVNTGYDIPEDFIPLKDIRIGIDDSVKNAGRNIRQLYDDLLANKQVPVLLSKICYGKGFFKEVDQSLRCRQLTAPRGTMSSAYGLADSQSDAIAVFTSLQDGEILAVNGPPGTGKTTLIQSIIASEVVARAIKGEDPAVIVGTSTNNQAVTNINQSLNTILRENPAVARFPWARRWIPDAETYGLYFPSKPQVEEAISKGYAIADGSYDTWKGFPEREDDDVYLAGATSDWLKGFSETYGKEANTIESGLETIRADLISLNEETHDFQILIERANAIYKWWRAEAGDVAPETFIAQEEDSLTKQVDLTVKKESESKQQIVIAKDAYDSDLEKYKVAEKNLQDAHNQHQVRLRRIVEIKGKIRECIAPRGFLEILGSITPIFRQTLRDRQIARLCALTASDPLIYKLFEKQSVENDPKAWSVRIDHLIRGANSKFDKLQAEHNEDLRLRREESTLTYLALARAEDAMKQTSHLVAKAKNDRNERLNLLNGRRQELEIQLRALREIYSKLLKRAHTDFQISSGVHDQIPEEPSINDFDRLLDITIRHMMFQKAMRYWEGRWIIEAQKVQNNNINIKRGLEGMQARFRRWCMLTPCLIITLDSLPKNFSFWQGDDGFMLEFIDLLVIDEAGQVGPHKGAAAFSLAKKAIVVGDIYQIEPISSVTSGIDLGNSKKCGLASLWKDGEPIAPHIASEVKSGAPQGSVMRLAQLATSFVSPGTEKEPGIFLAEHRRCRTEIVEYCNHLIYKGRLIPMSPAREKEPPLMPMAWAHVRGSVRRRGGSYDNPLEARAIADWIVKNASTWCREDFYGKKIEDIVAVVTPFRPQAQLIKSALRDAGHIFSSITVGTVHSLQGAEKPIVVFAPTYNADTTHGQMFFDRKPNMMNVAVSRAKDSFVVIGDMRLFRKRSSTPSSILGTFLFKTDNNELLDVEGNYSFSQTLLEQAERISTLERHREVLQTALTNAGQDEYVIIASPWITMKAIEADNIITLVVNAVQQRNVKIRVVVDRELSLRDPNHGAERAISELRKAGAVVCLATNMHNKTLIAGEMSITEGSFNWLSANRLQSDRFLRHETSWRISGQEAVEAIKLAKQEFAKIGADLKLTEPSN